MKYLIALFLTLGFLFTQAQDAANLRSVLLKQLKGTHTEKDWFVPISVALEGLTPQQVVWTDGSGNHSIGQLANHIVFWNERTLNTMLGQKNADFNGSNDETFNSFDQKKWNETLARLNTVMAGLEKFIQTADESTLKAHAAGIANVSTHNAYHTGQIVFVRKQQGAWNPEKGVK